MEWSVGEDDEIGNDDRISSFFDDEAAGETTKEEGQEEEEEQEEDEDDVEDGDIVEEGSFSPILDVWTHITEERIEKQAEQLGEENDEFENESDGYFCDCGSYQKFIFKVCVCVCVYAHTRWLNKILELTSFWLFICFV